MSGGNSRADSHRRSAVTDDNTTRKDHLSTRARAYSNVVDTTEELIDSARHLAGRGGRRLLGVAGAPGSGKSTLAEAVVDALGDQARLVSMDGFHLAQAELVRLGRADRKGAPDTFDPWGYVALLRRLRDASDDVVYAPRFDRDLEEPIAGAVRIGREVPLVVTEGNYLLVDEPNALRVEAGYRRADRVIE